jgi:hypothetical protein
MKHPSDQELLLAAEGELDRAHLDSCSVCRRRLQLLDRALNDYRDAQRSLPATRHQGWVYWFGGAVAALLALVVWMQNAPRSPDGLDPRLTPGAVAAEFHPVCGVESEAPLVSPAVAVEVFRRYGILKPRPGDYEVDYLVPADLGGTSGVSNLWPQPYARGVWNSRVKDALEDRLKARVCAGKMTLADAQRDLAGGWIEAYRRHFQTQQPLYEHAGFVKDRAWE